MFGPFGTTAAMAARTLLTTTTGLFDVKDTDAVAPTSVNWFAYTYIGAYTGGGNFNSIYNPGFEGVATSSATPEPGFYGVLALGLGGLVTIVSRRRKSA
jgi:MYXO-CTERM domain-containing protein